MLKLAESLVNTLQTYIYRNYKPQPYQQGRRLVSSYSKFLYLLAKTKGNLCTAVAQWLVVKISDAVYLKISVFHCGWV